MKNVDKPYLRVEGIVKSFPGVKVLKGITLECRPGEIQALVGENGAGKSTLMRVLTGAFQPDAGRILVDGALTRLASPKVAADHGIAMVYQDTKLVPHLDTPHNIWLGREPGGVLIDTARMRRETADVLARLGETLDLDQMVGEKPLAERQLIEIARGISNKARVLILDEPTSALSPREVERLFTILRDLRDAGTSIIFISHRLPEVFAICDRITVLKDGEIVGSVPSTGTDEDQIVRMMVGRDLSLTYPPKNASPGEVVLRVNDMTSPAGPDHVGFEVRAGEILGFGGIAGSGQQEIVRALFGLVPARMTVEVDGKPVTTDSPEAAIRAGVVYLPSDRRGEGMFLPHSIAENIVLPHVKDWSRLGILDRSRETEVVAEQIRSLNIRTSGPEKAVGLLSGGNQQKVTFARWLLASPRVCILDEPTQGVDVGAKVEIYTLIRKLADRGIAVIVVSSDVIELMGISDRILVVADGRVVDEMPAAEASEQRIVGAAVTAEIREKSESQSVARHRGKLASRYGAAALILGLVLLAGIATSLATPYFFTSRNLSSLALQIAPLVFVSIGQFAVIMLGGIDLSTGPNISLATAIASFLVATGSALGLALGVPIVLAASVGIGVMNGVLVRTLRLPDLVASIASFSVVAGLALIVRPSPGGSINMAFADLVLARVFNVPVAFIATVVLVILFEMLLWKSRMGISLIATGSREDAAFVAGIPTGKVRFLAYMFCGFMAGIAGLLVAARIGSGDPQAGANFTLLSVTAVVVGGTSVFGGRGTLVGVFFAACLLMIIQNAMNHLQVSAYWQYIFTGVLTLIAVGGYANAARLQRNPA